MEIILKEKYSSSKYSAEIKNIVIKKILDFSGIEWSIYGIGNSFFSGDTMFKTNNYSLEAKGYEYENLNHWCDSLRFLLLKHPRIARVDLNEPNNNKVRGVYDYHINIDKEMLGVYGMNIKDVYENYKSLTITKDYDLYLSKGAKQHYITIKSKSSEEYNIWNLTNQTINLTDRTLFVKDIIDLKRKKQEKEIYRENQEYFRLLEFEFTGEKGTGDLFVNNTLNRLKKNLPRGYSFKIKTDEKMFNEENKTNYVLLLFVVFFIIYVISAILLESLIQPLIIIGLIPITFIGVFTTFYFFDLNFDQGVLAGFVLLSGVTVNSAIFILHSFKNTRILFPEYSPITAYMYSFRNKIFPIVLTIISSIIGFIPFVKDGQYESFWFSLGASVIGGLTFSLIGILIFLPILILRNKT